MAVIKEIQEKELTAKLVLARSRSENLDTVKRINLWGQGITNINIVKQMPELEIVTLSANKISDLSPFRHCQKLKELYLRNNQVTNLQEVVFLKDLPYLMKLWLSDNPCALQENYRETVIRTLPFLTHLDDKEISSEERALSCQKGIELFLPVLDSHVENSDVLNSDGTSDCTMRLSNYSELPTDVSSGDLLSTEVNYSSFDECSMSTIRLNPSGKNTIVPTGTATSNKEDVISSKISTRERSLSCGTNHSALSKLSPLQTKVSYNQERVTCENQPESSKRVETSPTTTNSVLSHFIRETTGEAVGTVEVSGSILDASVMNGQATEEIRERLDMRPLPLSKLSEPSKSHLQKDRRDEDIRLAVLHLIGVLEHDSLLSVLDAIHERLKKDLVPRDSGSYKKNAYS